MVIVKKFILKRIYVLRVCRKLCLPAVMHEHKESEIKLASSSKVRTHEVGMKHNVLRIFFQLHLFLRFTLINLKLFRLNNVN